MSTVKTYSVDSGDATNLTLKTNGTTALTVDGTTQAVTISGSQTVGSNLTFTGTGNRITGDFSNATVANRVSFQTSTTNSATVIQVIPNGTSVLSALQLYSNTTGLNASFFNLIQDNTGTYFYSDKTGTGTYLPMVFNAGGNERMRIVGGTGSDVGNVGIGTASPGTVFQVSKASTSTIVGSSTAVVSVVNSQSSALGETAGIEFFNRNVGGSAKLAGVYGLYESYNVTGYAGSLVFATESAGASNVTERMRIDSSGNVGIGTSSTTSKLNVFDSGTGANTVLVQSGQTGTTTRSNTVLRLQTTATGRDVNIQLSDNITNSAEIGMVGGPMYFATGGVERMRIDSSGNVGIGTTSPSQKLSVIGNIVAGDTATTADGTITINSNGAGSVAITRTGTGATNSAMTFSTTFATLQERMRIDGSGNVGIGTSSPSSWSTLAAQGVSGTGFAGITAINNNSNVGIAGIQFASDSTYTKAAIGLIRQNANGNGSIVFYNSSSAGASNWTTSDEKMRIDSSGNLLVGTTSTINGSVCPIQALTTAANQAMYLRNSNAVPYGMFIDYSGAAPNNTTSFFADFRDTGGQRFGLRSNGGIANYSANNVNLSDERTKTEIQDAGNYLAKICSIPVRTFKYKDQSDDILNLGVIAQEVEAVAPELVDVSGFGETPEDGVPLKAIYQTDLQYALMKCIQEQQAIIEQLKADVAALKGEV